MFHNQEPSMQDTILEMLEQVERDHGVRIIFAAESGSRAWGFPSADADFDVRFVYAHPRDWYLSISEGRDVIELPLDAVLDIDLRSSVPRDCRTGVGPRDTGRKSVGRTQ
jgi:uncharacterized protein